MAGRLKVKGCKALAAHYDANHGVYSGLRDDAARAMGAGPGTVKRYLHLARRKLKGALR